MAARGKLFSLYTTLFALYLLSLHKALPATASKKWNTDKCNLKGLLSNPEDGGRKAGVTFRTDNCTQNWSLVGKHAIHEVSNVTFSHLSCDSHAAVVVHWTPSPLGIEHVKGFRVYLEDKNPEGKQCQHMALKEPRQLNFSFRNFRMSTQPFSGLAFETDYMVRIVPFPTFMNDSFFPPTFLRTNSCQVLLGSDNLVCKPLWKPRSFIVSQLGSSLHVVFDHAPLAFGFSTYYLYYKLRQDATSRMKRCRTDSSSDKTTCVLQDVMPGTYTIELRDESNTTRRQMQYHVTQVHSPWAGPIRAMAITVPLVIISAFATLFTVMCRKKQQENIYSHLDEESSESSTHTTALHAELPRPRPKVFLCYSNKDGPKHQAVIQSFAFFLQDFCGCEVTLDLWEHLDMCKEGQLDWLSQRMDEAHFIMVVCSKGMKHFVEKRSRRGKGGAGRGGGGGDLFVVAVAMIAERLRQSQQGSAEPPHVLAVYFDYSRETDVPAVLHLAPCFKLMEQLPRLCARLHGGHTRQARPAAERNYFRSRAGRALYVAVCNMHQHAAQQPDWFEQQLSPAPHTQAHAHAHPPPDRLECGLTLGEVKLQPLPDNEHMPCLAMLPAPQARAGPGSCPPVGLPRGQGEGSVPQDGAPPPRAGESVPSPLDMPRDSGIYDSSVPSSELSIPLMEGLSLCPDQADSSSLADSTSSSSGLGDEEAPGVVPSHFGMPTVCKAELHHSAGQGVAMSPPEPL